MIVRKATIADLDTVTSIEALCFPPKEAASRESFRRRLEVYPDYFWLVEDGNRVIGFLNGPVIDQIIIDDEMYADTACHNPDGEWQTVFGINTIPDYRKKGIGAIMMREMIDCARREERKGCVLTCKDYLLPFYESFGFKSRGVSESNHGGASWNDMVLEF